MSLYILDGGRASFLAAARAARSDDNLAPHARREIEEADEDRRRQARAAAVTDDRDGETNIHRFIPTSVGDGYRFDPDEVLEAAKGQGFSELVILGTLPNGERWVSGNCNAGEALILMERAKLEMIGGGE